MLGTSSQNNYRQNHEAFSSRHDLILHSRSKTCISLFYYWHTEPDPILRKKRICLDFISYFPRFWRCFIHIYAKTGHHITGQKPYFLKEISRSCFDYVILQTNPIENVWGTLKRMAYSYRNSMVEALKRNEENI